MMMLKSKISILPSCLMSFPLALSCRVLLEEDEDDEEEPPPPPPPEDGGVTGRVIVMLLDTGVDMLPRASFTKRYRVLDPSVSNVYVVGGMVVQEESFNCGVTFDSFSIYPPIPLVSVAFRVVIDIDLEVEVEGMVNDVMVGPVVSGLGSFRNMTLLHGAIVTLPVCFTPSRSTAPHGRDTDLELLVALYSKKMSDSFVMETGEDLEFWSWEEKDCQPERFTYELPVVCWEIANAS